MWRKARLVMKGCQQRPGIDYKELYSPVARQETIRSVLAISAREHLSLFQSDVATAFLAAELGDVELFMKQPEGFDDGTGRVCALRKAIYGASQTSRALNKKINKTLLEMKLVRLKQSSADPCLYVSDPPNRVIALIFADDGLLAAADGKLAKDFINELDDTFKLTSRPLDFFLGIHINDCRRTRVGFRPVAYPVFAERGGDFTFFS